MPTANKPKTKTTRGIDANLQKAWIASIDKEVGLRLKWFQNNLNNLNDMANKAPTRQVAEDLKHELELDRLESFKNGIKYPKIKTEDPSPAQIPRVTQAMMKPVDPKITELLYTGENKEGRLNYLKERKKLLPDQKYYFPEVSSFEYGWKMWDCAKNMKKTGFGRVQVVRDSFYRRNGVSRDPEWYKEPAGYSVSVCTC